jgi:hypothetical protein
MDVMPSMTANVMAANVMAANVMPANVIKEKKPTFKNIMAELLKPPPKDETKPNINLGGGHFSKLDKI